MYKSIEATGKTKDDAIQSALTQLGLTMDDVSCEILDIGRAGFFGIGAVPARVKVTYEVPDEPEETVPAAPKAEEPVQKAEPFQKAEPAPGRRERGPRKGEKAKNSQPAAEKRPAKAPVGEKNDKTAQVEEFLKGLFERMGVEAEAEAVCGEDGTVTVELTGSRVGALIGRRGETLDAIQHLCNYVVNSGENERTRVNVDAQNYRAKRSDALTGLAKKTASKVVRYKKNMTLEPMNAYERHVIHTALQDFEGVTTFSTGTEPNRRVVVAYERGAQGGDRPGPGKRQFKDRAARQAPAPAPQKKVEKEPDAGLQPVKPVREWC